MAPLSPQLTPNSKVKALLAAVDESSESDSPGNGNRNDIPTTQRQSLAETRAPQLAPKSCLTENEIVEGEAPIKPCGRLASRLNGQSAMQWDQGESGSSGSDKENAYARVKKRLMKESAKPAPEDSIPQITQEDENSQMSNPPVTSLNGGVNNVTTAIESHSNISQSTPGSFATFSPAKSSNRDPSTTQDPSSDSDLPSNPVNSTKFQQLVAKKRAEREAKEAEEAARKQKRMPSDFSDDSGVLSADEDAEQKLTQHSRPTRKASKKALEEMSRETQRMSRNMQLAHKAKTKKKISKQSLLDRFKFGTAALETLSEVKQRSSSSATASSAPASDHEDVTGKETPPTSPLLPNDEDDSESKQMIVEGEISRHISPSAIGMIQDELPDLMDILSQPIATFDKGKGKAIEISQPALPFTEAKSKRFDFKQRPIRIHHPKLTDRNDKCGSGSDSDLEVLPCGKTNVVKSDVFSRIPQRKIQDVRPLQTLRALAHLNSPPDSRNRRGKPSMSLLHLQNSLQQKARQQAAAERRAKIEELKARGIVVQTAEEKEQEQVEVEDLLERARRENAELREKEKRASNKEKLANGEAIDDSSDEYEDYEEDSEIEQDVELSGSDEELGDKDDDGDVIEESPEEQDHETEDAADETKDNGGLIADEASDDSRDEDDLEADVELEADDEDEEEIPKQQIQRHQRNRMVIDDDDDIGGPKHSFEDSTTSPALPEASGIEVPKIFQVQPGDMPMGMTQAFAATMADTQSQSFDNYSEEQDSLITFDGPPEPILPTLYVEDSLLNVEDTQEAAQQPELSQIQETSASNRISLDYSQSQIHYEGMDDVQTQSAATQMSEIPDPTQDAGFVLSSPGPEHRFVPEPPSTVDTVIIPSAAEGPVQKLKRRGRLQRRKVAEQESDDEPEEKEVRKVPKERKPDAFVAMKIARTEAAQREEFNKKKSEAKEMVEEQAQESEDEYAGLGGASDEDSGEEDEDVTAMIDHGKVKVGERRLAAFHA